MQVSVAIDGSKTRNLTFYVGDSVTIDLVVYAADGDTEAIATGDITGAHIVTEPAGVATFLVGTEFTVPDVCSPVRYRLIADVSGATTTMCTGKITLLGGSDVGSYDYGGVA